MPEWKQPLRKDPLANDRQVRVWASRMLSGVDVDPDKPEHREALEWAIREVSMRRNAFGTTDAVTLQQKIEASFLKHLERYKPVCVAPELDDELEDLRLVLTHPRLQQLWCEWADPPSKPSGPPGAYASAKATLLVFGWTAIGNLEDAWNLLRHRPNLLVLFESLERLRQGRAASALPGLGVDPAPLEMMSYPTVARQLPLVAQTLPLIAQCRVDLLRELADHFPSAPIGEVLSIDGTDHPHWIPQRGYKEDDPREQALRERDPQARFRAWGESGKDPGGKAELSADDKVTVKGFKKKWRGTYELPLCELVTGLPVVRHAQTDNEFLSLVPLMSDLYRVWPTVPLGIVAGDSGFDIAVCSRLLVVSYGVQGCFAPHDLRGDQQFAEGVSKTGSVWGVDEVGRLYCGICRKPMELKEQVLHKRRWFVDGRVQADPKTGELLNLFPGVENEPDKHRVRAECPEHGRPSIAMSANWKLLGGLPHYPEGRPDLYGKRLAIMARRSMSETYNSRLKTARRLCTSGPDRVRIKDPRSLNALLEIAALSFVAQQVYDERCRRGIAGRLGVPATGKAPPTTGIVGAPEVAA